MGLASSTSRSAEQSCARVPSGTIQTSPRHCAQPRMRADGRSGGQQTRPYLCSPYGDGPLTPSSQKPVPVPNVHCDVVRKTRPQHLSCDVSGNGIQGSVGTAVGYLSRAVRTHRVALRQRRATSSYLTRQSGVRRIDHVTVDLSASPARMACSGTRRRWTGDSHELNFPESLAFATNGNCLIFADSPRIAFGRSTRVAGLHGCGR